jgi:uncharacterized protein DUF1877
MSMICWVLGVTSAQINALRAKPALVSKLTLVAQIDLGAHLDDLTQRMTPEQRAQLEASQAQFAANPAVKKAEATVADARAAVGPLGPIEKALSLEKSWHLLHYLFTGHVGTWHPGELLSSEVEAGEVYEIFAPDRLYDERHAPGSLLLSGEELGENVGYGPARLHDQSKTSDFSRFLAGQDLARLRAHTDFDAMNRAGVPYGAGEPGDEALHQMLHEEIALYFQLLRDYVRAMADKGNGLMVWIS